ncbi:hypothetical protein IR012_01185 [Pseudomonas putida]|uniref:hypothetical protein n=1 Tax=Pseudomonas putida TaxID=303 RepID=UPI0018AA981B|nr:hypothetical protein [Pseudomonas putida]MBF8668957.1 hypothetical protein [Pseudomonas putida]MBF8710926.1 hypothetical protein [Pseudomonas putida]
MDSKVSVPAQEVGTQSFDEFIEKMAVAPQTYKWDALLVFDRSAANTLLAQEYVDRADVPEIFFPKLPDGNVDSGNGIEHVLLGLVLDRARLSFENANLRNPKAKLQMRLVGGKHVEVIETFIDGKAVRSVQSLIVYNAATHGLLDMDIELVAVEGSVNDSGKVLLDINKAYEHRFSGGATGPEKIRLGLYFDRVFKIWSSQKKEILQFPLSELVVDNDSPINPGIFALGTHAPKGGRVLGSENYGDGAVVVFVAMKGNAAGDYPSSDEALLYMLPEASEPYTSNLVLSNKFIAHQVVKLGLDQFDWMKGKFDVEELPGSRYKLVANNDQTLSSFDFDYFDSNNGGTLQPWYWKLSINGAYARVFSKGSELVFKDKSIVARWTSASDVAYLKYWIQTGNSSGGTKTLNITSRVTIDASYKFEVSRDGGKAVLKFSMSDFMSDVDISIEDGFGSGNGAEDAREKSSRLIAPLKAALSAELRKRAESLKNMTFEIDALRLNNLLFRGENVVEPRDVALPTDLTMLGNLAPKRTMMVISPAEPIVASGQEIDFEAQFAPGAVKWEVSNLPGETGKTGAFKDPSKGRYTAPSDDALRMEGHRRLIVTATSGDLVSKALISVVPSHVSVNPWVAAVNVGKHYALSAGTPDSAALTWDKPELGDVAPDSDPLNPGGYRYTAPVKLPKREAGEPNHYRALRLDPVTVRPAAGGAPATIDMLVVGPKNPNYWLEPEARDDGSVALPFYKLNLDFEKVEVPEPVEWTVLRGSGTVDPKTRVFTPTPGADDQYVIISAYYVNEFSADTHDYIILPLPFVPAQRYADLLNPAIKEV